MGWNQSAGLLEDRESVTIIEAGSASANGRPAFVIFKGKTPRSSDVPVSRPFLQLSKVLSIEDTLYMQMYEL
ncbi:MAG: hypothetical protein SEPTF4163_002012 [Sporothrix epigloea]